jgi:hypothetical protein
MHEWISAGHLNKKSIKKLLEEELEAGPVSVLDTLTSS